MESVAVTARDTNFLSRRSQKESDLFVNLFSLIKSSALAGDMICYYATGNVKFTDPEFYRIQNLGYSITWDEENLLYIVSWEHI